MLIFLWAVPGTLQGYGLRRPFSLERLEVACDACRDKPQLVASRERARIAQNRLVRDACDDGGGAFLQ